MKKGHFVKCISVAMTRYDTAGVAGVIEHDVPACYVMEPYAKDSNCQICRFKNPCFQTFKQVVGHIDVQAMVTFARNRRSPESEMLATNYIPNKVWRYFDLESRPFGDKAMRPLSALHVGASSPSVSEPERKPFPLWSKSEIELLIEELDKLVEEKPELRCVIEERKAAYELKRRELGVDPKLDEAKQTRRRLYKPEGGTIFSAAEGMSVLEETEKKKKKLKELQQKRQEESEW